MEFNCNYILQLSLIITCIPLYSILNFLLYIIFSVAHPIREPEILVEHNQIDYDGSHRAGVAELNDLIVIFYE